MTKFTPGPWGIDCNQLGKMNHSALIVRDEHPCGNGMPKEYGICVISVRATMDERDVESSDYPELKEADARLIAAAPEMYEALERLARVAAVELTGKRDDVLEQAQSALSKARGEE